MNPHPITPPKVYVRVPNPRDTLLSRQRSFSSTPGRINTWEKIGDLTATIGGSENDVSIGGESDSATSIMKDEESSSSMCTSATETSKNYDFSQPDDENTIIFRDETKTSVKACLFDKLIEKLTISSPIIDLDDFLLTYRSFCTPNELLNVLFARYRQLCTLDRDTKAEQLRVFLVFRRWIEKYMYDFTKESTNKDTLISFLEEVISVECESQNIAKTILQKIEKKVITEETAEKVYTNESNNQIALLDYQTIDIAQQLTIIGWNHWSRIQSWELLDLSWTKKDKNIKAPNVVAMISKFNQISDWVATVLCTTENLKTRIKVLKKFIDIADHLKEFGNFDGFMEIFSGLRRSSCQRLKKTFQGLDTKYEKKIEELSELVECTNHVNIRNAINSFNPPVIPYLGMYLSDLVFINDGIQDSLNGKINFYKCMKCSETIKRIKQYQLKGYPWPENKEIQYILQNIVTLKEEQLYEISLYLEPREGKEKPTKPIELDNYQSQAQYLYISTEKTSKIEFSRSTSMGSIKVKDRSFSLSGLDKPDKINALAKSDSKIFSGDKLKRTSSVKDKIKDRERSSSSLPERTSTSNSSKTSRVTIKSNDKSPTISMKVKTSNLSDDLKNNNQLNVTPRPTSSSSSSSTFDFHPISTGGGITIDCSLDLFDGIDEDSKTEDSLISDIVMRLERKLYNDSIIPSLLALHRFFATSQQLLDELLVRFEGKQKDIVFSKANSIVRLVPILQLWIQNYRSDFDDKMMKQLTDFTQRNSQISSDLIQIINQSTFQKIQNIKPTLEFSTIIESFKTSGISLISFDPTSVANQMTFDAIHSVSSVIDIFSFAKETEFIKNKIKTQRLSPYNNSDVTLLADIIQGKYLGILGFNIQQTNENVDPFFTGSDALNWFRNVLGLGDEQINVWTLALSKNNLFKCIQACSAQIMDKPTQFTFYDESIYQFNQQTQDVFRPLSFEIDSFASDSRKIVLNHLNQIKLFIMSAVEVTKLASQDLALKTLVHIFQIAQILHEQSNWHSLVGVISGLHFLINNENRALWNSVSFSDLQWFFKIRKQLITPSSLDDLLSESNTPSENSIPNVLLYLDALQKCMLHKQDLYIQKLGNCSSKPTIHVQSFIKYGLVLHHFIKSNSATNQIQIVEDVKIQALFRDY